MYLVIVFEGLYDTDKATRSYSPREEFRVTGMSMKHTEPFLQIDSWHMFLSDISFLCMFMRRKNEHDSKTDIEFTVIYSLL